MEVSGLMPESGEVLREKRGKRISQDLALPFLRFNVHPFTQETHLKLDQTKESVNMVGVGNLSEAKS